MSAEARAALEAERQRLRDLVMSPAELLEERVRQFLIEYAWWGTSDEQIAEVDCIMAQGEWKFADAMADKFAGAQSEPGPEAFADGVGFALTALYECHDGPHQASCPLYKEG